MSGDQRAAIDTSDGLGALLHRLAGYPSPHEALLAIIEGPLRRLGAWAGLMWLERDGYLDTIAGHRTDGLFDELYARIPVGADMPVPLCFRESEVIVIDVASMGAVFEPLAAHEDAWADTMPDVRSGTLVHIPMVSRGVSLGVVGVACTESFALDTLQISFLDGVGAALGLWVTHPATPLPDGALAPANPEAGTPEVTLSPRQQQIVRLIRESRSNAAIAVQLGCSVSTVKQEIQRIQREVRASDRTDAAARAVELGLVQG